MNIDLFACRGKRVCVALSGGGDSVALFHCLKECAPRCGVTLSAVNVEHGIRGESSRADSAFVKDLCARGNVPLYFYSADIPALAKERGTGVEEAARRFRYQLFLRLLREDKADVIATAHHAGDNAESVLFNLFRGSSLTGAGGIRAFLPAAEPAARFSPETAAEDALLLKGKGIARPLLGVSKAEILQYLRENNLQWREDETNADTAYTRNFLRRDVLAPARERFPALDKALYNFSRMAREDDEFLYSLTDGYYSENGGECAISESAPKPVFMRCCVRALRYFGVEQDYTLANMEEVYALTHGENGGTADLPGGARAVRDYGKITVYRPQSGGTAAETEVPFGEGGFDFGKYGVQILRGAHSAADERQKPYRQLVFDGAKLPAGCVLRLRKAGDVFRKFGGGTKKLKDFFIDKKIPQRERDLLPVLACGNEIYAVCGVEISDKVKLDDASETIFTVILFEKGDSYKCTRT